MDISWNRLKEPPAGYDAAWRGTAHGVGLQIRKRRYGEHAHSRRKQYEALCGEGDRWKPLHSSPYYLFAEAAEEARLEAARLADKPLEWTSSTDRTARLYSAVTPEARFEIRDLHAADSRPALTVTPYGQSDADRRASLVIRAPTVEKLTDIAGVLHGGELTGLTEAPE